jgi:hypothetical protein
MTDPAEEVRKQIDQFAQRMVEYCNTIIIMAVVEHDQDQPQGVYARRGDFYAAIGLMEEFKQKQIYDRVKMTSEGDE